MAAERAKVFYLPKEAIDPDMAPGRGGCLASDRITVDRYRVGYMYREDPDHDWDSGWRFFAGIETDEYTEDPSNFDWYDVNTLANYDAEVIPFLDAPSGSAFERDASSGSFVRAPFPDTEE